MAQWPDDVRWRQRFDNFKRARQQLQSALDLRQQRALSALEQQGLIQAFEYTHELAWKVMKDYLSDVGGLQLIGSRDSTRAAFAAGLIADGEGWMAMIVSRNLTSHTYNLDTATALVADVAARYADLFEGFDGVMAALERAGPMNQ